MVRSVRLKAEAQFTATQKKADEALKEKERLKKERAEQRDRLRGLRLAKEASDQRAANGEAPVPNTPSSETET